jgi:hypothetical protein
MEGRNRVKDDEFLEKNASRDSIGIDDRSVEWFIRSLVRIIEMKGSRAWSNINFDGSAPHLFPSSPVTSCGSLNTSCWNIPSGF